MATDGRRSLAAPLRRHHPRARYIADAFSFTFNRASASVVAHQQAHDMPWPSGARVVAPRCNCSVEQLGVTDTTNTRSFRLCSVLVVLALLASGLVPLCLAGCSGLVSGCSALVALLCADFLVWPGFLWLERYVYPLSIRRVCSVSSFNTTILLFYFITNARLRIPYYNKQK